MYVLPFPSHLNISLYSHLTAKFPFQAKHKRLQSILNNTKSYHSNAKRDALQTDETFFLPVDIQSSITFDSSLAKVPGAKGVLR